MRVLRLSAVAVLLFACGMSPAAQSNATSTATRTQMEEKRGANRPAREVRQKQVEADADRLVELAQQLKAHVDKTNKDVLSIEVIREAERIEKLARETRQGVPPLEKK